MSVGASGAETDVVDFFVEVAVALYCEVVKKEEERMQIDRSAFGIEGHHGTVTHEQQQRPLL